MLRHTLTFTHGAVSPLVLFGLLLWMRWDNSAKRPGQAKRLQASVGEWVGRVVLAGMLLSFFGAFLTTPSDLDWHIRAALDRLYLQVWPLAIWLGFVWLNRETQISTTLP